MFCVVDEDYIPLIGEELLFGVDASPFNRVLRGLTICVLVPAEDDDILEDDETFVVTLSTNDSDVIFAISSSNVVIADTDRKDAMLPLLMLWLILL